MTRCPLSHNISPKGHQLLHHGNALSQSTAARNNFSKIDPALPIRKNQGPNAAVEASEGYTKLISKISLKNRQRSDKR